MTIRTSLGPILGTLAFATFIILGLVGCGGEDGATPTPSMGALEIDVMPDGIGGGWTVSTSSRAVHAGVEDTVLTGLEAGAYTVVWDDVLGYHTPWTQHHEVVAGDTTLALGSYAIDPNATGIVHIDVEPDVRDGLSLRWVLKVAAGEGEYDVEGEGDQTVEDVPAGFLTVDWQPVPDWVEPHGGAFDYTLDNGEELTVVGTWTPREALEMELVRVEDGVFVMGAPEWELGYAPPFYTDPLRPDDEAPQHEVWLTRALLVSATEVTQHQYEAVMGAAVWDFGPSANLPAQGLTWFQAVQFCNAMSLDEGLTPAYAVNGSVVNWNQDADGYRLPTEAEWEYLCRGGRPEAFAFGPITAVIDPDAIPTPDPEADPVLDRIGWYRDAPDALAEPRPVASRLPNAYGLYDMHGNVYEWCWDQYDAFYYDGSPYQDPTGPATGFDRVLRGGSYYSLAQECRSASRFRLRPDSVTQTVGFRVVRPAAVPPSADKPRDKD